MRSRTRKLIARHPLVAIAWLLAVLAAAFSTPAHAQCGGNVTLTAPGLPDQALLGEMCAIRGGEVFVSAVNTGTVHIYRRQTGATPFANLGAFVRPANIGVADAFGRGLAAHNDVVAVGAPLWSGNKGTVTLYTRNAAGAWSTLQQIPSPSAQANMYFGTSIALSAGYMVVGAPGALNASNFMAGIVYLYQRQADGTYALLRTLQPSSPNQATDGMFGQSVGISNSNIIVAAPGELYGGDARRGSLYVFQRQTNGDWTQFDREKSTTATATTRAYGVDCAIDGNLIAVREQSTNPGASDTVWLYSIGGAALALEPSFLVGANDQFSFSPPIDAALVGTVSMRDGYLAVGCRKTERVDLFSRGATQWNFVTFYTNGGLGDVDFGASVAVGHDIMSVGIAYWQQSANLDPGACWTQPHVSRDCDADSQSDACEAMSQANSAADDDFDGVPDNCDTAVVPAAATASAGTIPTAVGVSWSVAAGANQYQVRRASGGGPFSVLAWTYAPVHTDTTAEPDITYTYTIRSVDGSGAVGSSFAQASGWRPFAAPTGLTASDGTESTHVTVSWTAVAGAPAYKVFRAVGAGTPVEIGQPVGATFNDTGGTAGTTYTYTVKVKGALGDSAASNSDTGFRTNLAIPSNVAATDGTSTTAVTVTWNAVSGASGYKVYRGASAGSETFLADVAGGASVQYNDAAATALTNYSYAVRAVAGSALSSVSTSNAGWRNVAAPGGVSASDGSSVAAVNLAWNAVSNATGYVIWRAPTGGTLTQRATVGATPLTFADTTATQGLSYTYAVQAVHALGTTALSATDAGWRAFDPPAACDATDGTFADRIRVTWTAVAGAQGYRVWRLLPGGSEEVLVTVGAGVLLHDDTAVGALLNTRYRVAVYSPEVGSSTPSVANFGWRNVNPPGNVAATDGTSMDHVAVSWNAVGSATQYKVYRSFNGGPAGLIATVPAGTLATNDATATPLVAYAYSVRAVHALGETELSAPNTGWRNTAGPAVAASDGRDVLGVRVEWDALPNATAYQLYRAAPGQPLALVATMAGTSYLDKVNAPAVLHTYSVRAVHALGVTPQGASDTGWRSLDAPRTVDASDGTIAAHVGLKWMPVKAATGYSVTRYGMGEHPGAPVFLGIVAPTELTDPSAVPGVRYRYEVSAVCALGTCASNTGDVGWRPDNGSGHGGGFGGGHGGLGDDGLGGSGSGGGGSGGGGSGAVQPPAGDPATEPSAEPSDGNAGGLDGNPPIDSFPDAPKDESKDPRATDPRLWHHVSLATPLLWPGDLELPSACELTLTLGLPGQPLFSGALWVQGSATLAGTLNVQIADARLATPGAMWMLISAEGVHNQFAQVKLPSAPAGMTYELVETRNGLWLRVGGSR